MLSILDIINKTEAFFEGKGIASPKLEAELIVAHCLNLKRLDLYLQFERPLPEVELSAIRDAVKRRSLREPLQFIEGYAEFRDLKLQCDSRALIPRPETEELVEMIIQAAGSKQIQRILDLGTGTGAIALSLKSAFPDADIVAVDKSPEALNLAKENAIENELEVEFLESSWFDSVEGEFDIIVSNPPYLTDEEWETAEPEVRDYEPKSALVAPDSGFADLKEILEQAPSYLMKGGSVYFETGIGHRESLLECSATLPYENAEVMTDFSGRDRFFKAQKQ